MTFIKIRVFKLLDLVYLVKEYSVLDGFECLLIYMLDDFSG